MFALVRSTRQPGEPRNLLPDAQIGAGRGSWRSHLECRGAAKCGPDASSAHANVKLHDPPVYPEGDVLPALDTKQTCRSVNGVSAFGGKAKEAMSRVTDGGETCRGPMKAAIEQFRTQLGAAIDCVDPVKRALDTEVPDNDRGEALNTALC